MRVIEESRRSSRARAVVLVLVTSWFAGCTSFAGERGPAGPPTGTESSASAPVGADVEATSDPARRSRPDAPAAADPASSADPAPAADRVPSIGPAPEPAADPSPSPELAPVSADTLRAVVAALPAPRHPTEPGHAAARAFLLSRLESFGLAPRVLPFETAGLPGSDLANLEVRWPGSSDEPGLVIVGAHYDTVRGCPGADDNGSGVAVLLELARRLATRTFEHELRFVWFDAEEDGLIGSARYVLAMSDADRARTLGMLSLETMGFTARAPGSQRWIEPMRPLLDPGDRGDFLLLVGTLRSAGVVERLAEAFAPFSGSAFRAEAFAWLPGEGWMVPDTRRSDHAPFWDGGMPAVLVTDTADFRNPHYHRPSDVPATLDYAFLAGAAWGLEAALEQWLDES